MGGPGQQIGARDVIRDSALLVLAPTTGTPRTVPIGSEGRPEASFLIDHRPGGVRLLHMHEGDHRTVEGLTVRVLHIWVAPDSPMRPSTSG
jgi:hypothetical protein